MGLSELFRNMFSRTKPSSEGDRGDDIGVTGLPRNIEDDLLRHREQRWESHNHYGNWTEDWVESPQHYQIIIDQDSGGAYNENEDHFNMSHDILQQLDEMMKHMFGSMGSFRIEDSFPNNGNIEGILDDQTSKGENEGKSLRDKMLKDPHEDGFPVFKHFEIPSFDESGDEVLGPRSMMDWSWTFPFGSDNQRPYINDHKDRDFDSELQSGKSKLSEILDKEDENSRSDATFRNNHSFGSFSSIVTKRRADGIIESQKTVKDSNGNEEVTVIRKLGDQTHKKTIMKDSSGNEEVKEDLLNMDEGDLEKFEQAWLKSEVKGESIPPAMRNGDFGRGLNLSGSLYDNIRDLFLPWNRND